MTKKKSKRKSKFSVNPNGNVTGRLEWNHKQLSSIKRMVAASFKNNQ